jgi:hypothetical protein
VVLGRRAAEDRPVQNHEPDVRGRAVVWSAGSLHDAAADHRWRRVLGNAGLLGGVGLGVSGLLIGVATWSVITPVGAQTPRQLWVTPPHVERGVPVADATSAPPSVSATGGSPTALPTGSPTSDDHGGRGRDDAAGVSGSSGWSGSATSGSTASTSGTSGKGSGTSGSGTSGSGSTGSGSSGSGASGSGGGSGSDDSGSSGGSGHSGKG